MTFTFPRLAAFGALLGLAAIAAPTTRAAAQDTTTAGRAPLDTVQAADSARGRDSARAADSMRVMDSMQVGDSTRRDSLGNQRVDRQPKPGNQPGSRDVQRPKNGVSPDSTVPDTTTKP